MMARGLFSILCSNTSSKVANFDHLADTGGVVVLGFDSVAPNVSLNNSFTSRTSALRPSIKLRHLWVLPFTLSLFLLFGGSWLLLGCCPVCILFTLGGLTVVLLPSLICQYNSRLGWTFPLQCHHQMFPAVFSVSSMALNRIPWSDCLGFWNMFISLWRSSDESTS